MLAGVATGLKMLSPAYAAFDLYRNHSKYLPAIQAAAEFGGKALQVAKDILPKAPEAIKEYKNLSKALDYFKNHTITYHHKEGGASFNGSTPKSIGRFFKSKEGSWDIFSPGFEKNNPSAIQALLKEVYYSTVNPDLLQLRVAQILAKKLVSNCSRNLEEGFKIEIPVVNAQGATELVQYTLDRKFSLWEDIPAFGFVDPEHKHPPLLIFRPTNLDVQYADSVSSIIANLHPKGPAWKLYEGAKQELDSWLQQSSLNGKNKARILGFSQGGILATYMLTYHSRYISQATHKPSFVLDGPGLPNEIASDWKKLKRKPHVWSFVTKGDLVPKVGTELIGQAYEIELPYKISRLQSHTATASLAERWSIREIDKKKEKESEMRKAFHGVQNLAGKYFYPLLEKTILPKLKEICA